MQLIRPEEFSGVFNLPVIRWNNVRGRGRRGVEERTGEGGGRSARKGERGIYIFYYIVVVCGGHSCRPPPYPQATYYSGSVSDDVEFYLRLNASGAGAAFTCFPSGNRDMKRHRVLWDESP